IVLDGRDYRLRWFTLPALRLPAPRASGACRLAPPMWLAALPGCDDVRRRRSRHRWARRERPPTQGRRAGDNRPLVAMSTIAAVAMIVFGRADGRQRPLALGRRALPSIVWAFDPARGSGQGSAEITAPLNLDAIELEPIGHESQLIGQSGRGFRLGHTG